MCYMGTQHPAPSQKREQHAKFRPMSVVAKRLDLIRCSLVRRQASVHATLRYMGNQLPQKGHNPQFSPHVCCGKMAGWIKMPLGTEVGFCQGDIVLDGEPAPPPPKKGTAHPLFGPCLLEVGLGAGHVVLDGDPAPPRKGSQQHPTFRPTSVVAKRRPSQQLLSSCYHLVFYVYTLHQSYEKSLNL